MNKQSLLFLLCKFLMTFKSRHSHHRIEECSENTPQFYLQTSKRVTGLEGERLENVPVARFPRERRTRVIVTNTPYQAKIKRIVSENHRHSHQKPQKTVRLNGLFSLLFGSVFKGIRR